MKNKHFKTRLEAVDHLERLQKQLLRLRKQTYLIDKIIIKINGDLRYQTFGNEKISMADRVE